MTRLLRSYNHYRDQTCSPSRNTQPISYQTAKFLSLNLRNNVLSEKNNHRKHVNQHKRTEKRMPMMRDEFQILHFFDKLSDCCGQEICG